MAKWANDSVIDALLDKVATSTQLLVTTTQPADRAAALSAALASATMNSGQFTKADSSSPAGRRLTVAQQANINVTATGSATHVCLVDGTSLLYVTTVTAQTLTSGNTVTVPAWNITVADPS